MANHTNYLAITALIFALSFIFAHASPAPISIRASKSNNNQTSVPIPYKADGLNCTVSTDPVSTATLIDCQALLASNGTALRKTFVNKETCAYISDKGYERAASSRVVGCHGNCCLSYAYPANTNPEKVNVTAQQVIPRAEKLLKCGANAGSGHISARELYKDGTGLCLLQGNSTCGCFDDLLWTPDGAPVDDPEKRS
ncbi:uncharacterized protein FA14DRAFT_28178 [Meira miltonrushii]|uniref:Cyanovirin-N domain-containing protein n=1 Tax=Meira miltonrushii TaxID=1280837 RepID=A0A316VMR9_9BASI|nr:uncharacterized protein FA14DRAFT_28178 [Meira miltonrushii]PWN38594.1 hypothetical protein FA14DRAFT_28178 [Meira miltonrushii]